MVFLNLYRYFKKHKLLMYSILIVSSIVFVFFGLKTKYEEDMTSLLPSSDSNDSGLVFGNLKVKDKIIFQMTGQEPEVMAGYVDELMDSLFARNVAIADTLYKIDVETLLSAKDYVVEHLPCFVDTGMYTRFDAAIDKVWYTMEDNAAILEDEPSDITIEAITSDPLNLRSLVLPSVGDGLGFAIIDEHLFSADSTVALAFISPDFHSFDSKQGARLVSEVEKVVSSFRAAHPDVEVLYHGAPVRSACNSDILHFDIFFTVSLALVIIFIFICVCFNSFNIIWQNILPVAYGTFFALACMYWIKGSISLMALAVGVMILGVAISYCLHIIIHHRFVGDVEKMLADESKPVFLGCLTTIGAFLGLLFTNNELLKDIGLFSTFALSGGTFFALAFLPHFLSYKKSAYNQKAFNIINRINDFPFDKNPILVGALVIIIIVGFIFTPKVQFDNNLKSIGYQSEDVLKSEALFAQKNTNGALQRYYAVAAPTLDEALEANKALSTTLDSMKAEGKIRRYTPVVSTLFQSEAEQQRRIDAWHEYWNEAKIEETMDKVNMSATDYGINSPEMVFEPFCYLLEADYEPDNLYEANILPEGLLRTFIEESDGKFLVFNVVQMDSVAKDANDSIVAAVPHALIVDPFYYTGNMVSLVREDFNITLIISALFVLAVLLISFRNILVALLAFLPMFLSWYVVQGWMAILGVNFNLFNIIVSTFIFGIGVDYSIFVVQGLISEATGKDTKMLEYHKVAILFSALTLIIVMVSMSCATHPAIKSISYCSLIGMVSSILITYSLQPLIFRWLLKLPFFKKSLK